VDNDYLAYTLITDFSGLPPPQPVKGRDFFVYDTTTNVSYHDWMPMVHLKIKPANWFDVRFSFTKTIARPDFNDLMPFQTLSTNPGSSIQVGNPNLKPARSRNRDVYLSLYDSFWGLFTVGYFHKDIEDVNVDYRTYLDSRTRLDSLNQAGLNLVDNQYGKEKLFVDHTLTVPINLTKTLDVLQATGPFVPFPFPHFETIYIPVEREIAVPGQADRLANLSLGYDIRGFSARVSMFHQSGSLRGVGVIAERDRYDDGYTRWDLSVRQRISGNLEAYFNVANLTETRDRVYVFRNNRPTSLESFGRTADLGIQFRL
jgi:TonB-dependent receptor